jgi:hypothetical protein
VGDVRREAEGTNFRRILSEVRRGLGLRRMAEGRLAIGEVAFLPGFSEVSAFHRAFQQWTGHAPMHIACRRIPSYCLDLDSERLPRRDARVVCFDVAPGCEQRCLQTCELSGLGRIEFSVGTTDGQHLPVREPRQGMTSGLLQFTGACPGIGRRIVEEAVGAGGGLATVYYEAASKQSFSSTQQRQGAIANSCAACAIGPRPGIGGRVVELAGITGKMVSIDKYVTVCEKHGSEATGTEGVVHCACHRPLPVGRIVEFGTFVCDQRLPVLEQSQRRKTVVVHAARFFPGAGGWVVEFGAIPWGCAPGKAPTDSPTGNQDLTCLKQCRTLPITGRGHAASAPPLPGERVVELGSRSAGRLGVHDTDPTDDQHLPVRKQCGCVVCAGVRHVASDSPLARSRIKQLSARDDRSIGALTPSDQNLTVREQRGSVAVAGQVQGTRVRPGARRLGKNWYGGTHDQPEGE